MPVAVREAPRIGLKCAELPAGERRDVAALHVRRQEQWRKLELLPPPPGPPAGGVPRGDP